MANQEHLAILTAGVNSWNAWRRKNRELIPDLTFADLIRAALAEVDLKGAVLNQAELRGADLCNARLRRADLSEAQLTRADLSGADLREANLRKADLVKAELSRAHLEKTRLEKASLKDAVLWEAVMTDAHLAGADLRGANLRGTDLRKADLREVNLLGADLRGTLLTGANLSQVRVGWTLFGELDLSEVTGLDSAVHSGPSTVGMDTVFNSKGKIPEKFLRGCGFRDYQIEFAKLAAPGMARDEVTAVAYDMVNLYSGQGLQFYSCFISYNSKDERFARKLHDDLQVNGIRCWFAPEDIQGGRKVYQQIDEAIRVHDNQLSYYRIKASRVHGWHTN